MPRFVGQCDTSKRTHQILRINSLHAADKLYDSLYVTDYEVDMWTADSHTGETSVTYNKRSYSVATQKKKRNQLLKRTHANVVLIIHNIVCYIRLLLTRSSSSCGVRVPPGLLVRGASTRNPSYVRVSAIM